MKKNKEVTIDVNLKTLVVHYYLFIIQIEKTTNKKDLPTWLIQDKKIIEKEVLSYE